MGAYTFLNSKIEEITFPESITEIRPHTFEGCSHLTKVNLSPHIVSIGSSAFSGCRKLTDIELPQSLVMISNDAFLNCSIEKLSIPSSVELVYGGCFKSNMTELEVEVPRHLIYNEDVRKTRFQVYKFTT